MCRSIKQLRGTDHRATETEITEAALQYVRKVSGYRKPSRSNQAAFLFRFSSTTPLQIQFHGDGISGMETLPLHKTLPIFI